MLDKWSKFKQVEWQKLCPALYLEPLMFILVFARTLSGNVIRNEIIYQSCTVVFGYNETECEQLGTNNLSEYAKAIETEVQPYAANLFMIRSVLDTFVPAFCGVFVGSWADNYGRKPLLVISMIGFSFTYGIVAVLSGLSHHYVINPWYYAISVLPHSLLGGNCVFSVALYCYISDVTDTKTCPYRMISLEASNFIALMTGSLLCSYVYEATGATITFSISATLLSTATVFVFFIPESLERIKNSDTCKVIPIDLVADVIQECEEKKNVVVLPSLDTIKELDENVKENPTPPEVEANLEETIIEDAFRAEEATLENGKADGKDGAATGLFSYLHITDMLKACFQKRPYCDRSIIWLVTGVMFLSLFANDGVVAVFYLFVREKFQWTIRDYTFYETVCHTTPMLGAIVGFVVLRKIFKMSVVTLALLSCISELLSNFVKGVAAEPWHLYLSACLGAFKSIGGPMCRTIVSNIVPPDDLGKIYSIKNILQAIAPCIAAPVYAVIYKLSLTTDPGLFNIVSAGLYLLATVFVLFVLRFKYLHKEHYISVLK